MWRAGNFPPFSTIQKRWNISKLDDVTKQNKIMSKKLNGEICNCCGRVVGVLSTLHHNYQIKDSATLAHIYTIMNFLKRTARPMGNVAGTNKAVGVWLECCGRGD
jgi:hypothetical protein